MTRGTVNSAFEGTQDEAFKRALVAIENENINVLGAIDEYLRFFSRNLERLRIAEFEGEIDDAITASLDSFLPMRNEYIRFISKLACFDPNVRWIVSIHRFVERLFRYTHSPKSQKKRIEYDLDNYSFILHEIFLYTVAVLLKYDRLEHAAYLFSKRYYVVQGSSHGLMTGFDDIHKHMGSLVNRSERLEIGTEALRADLLRERCRGTEASFNDLMQADFTIFLRAELDHFPLYSKWWPELLMFLGEVGGSFDIFVRARSKDYFDRLSNVLGISEPRDLQQLIEAYKKETRDAPRGMKPRTIANLVGYEFLTISMTT